jgi:hypothetical protein
MNKNILILLWLLNIHSTGKTQMRYHWCCGGRAPCSQNSNCYQGRPLPFVTHWKKKNTSQQFLSLFIVLCGKNPKAIAFLLRESFCTLMESTYPNFDNTHQRNLLKNKNCNNSYCRQNMIHKTLKDACD